MISGARLVFLLGAGASKKVLPDSNGLARRFHHYLQERYQASTDPADLRLLDLYRFLDGGIRNQRGLLGEDPSAAVNIEQIASAALRLSQRSSNPISPYVQGFSTRLEQFEREQPQIIERFINVMFGNLSAELGESRDGISAGWRPDEIKYLGHLSEFANVHKASFFSLNYDLCLERAVQEEGDLELVNGFSISGWSPEVFDQPDGFKLYKLHGSLDWRRDPEHGIVSIEYPRYPHASEVENLKALLIFGTDEKMSGEEPFLSLVYLFSQALSKGELLICCGYSFSDTYINDIIKQRFDTNTKMRIIILSPDASELKSQHDFLRGSPRVKDLCAKAEEVLANRDLKKEIDRSLKDVRSGDPF